MTELDERIPRRIGVPDPPERREMVDHPRHYNQGEYEVIDVIEDWDLGFHLGNSVKYIARAGHKAPQGDSSDTDSVREHRKKRAEVEDLKKARWYLERRISNLEASL